MNSWFYTSMPKLVMDQTRQAIDTPPQFEAGDFAWYVTGAGWLTVSVLVRRAWFWFPHPIGLIMLINPLISSLWFSFFLGWVAKAVVVRYGGKATFDKAKLFFIGLILGELMAFFIWLVVSLIGGISFSSNFLLNRLT